MFLYEKFDHSFHFPQKEQKPFLFLLVFAFVRSSKQLLAHDLDKERGIPIDDYKFIKFHMSNHISKLAQHIKIRQRVIATAVTYMRRVYTRKSLSEYEPRLVAPTCLYLACKAEESVVHAKLLVFYMKKLYADEKFRYEIKDILEMEMKVLEALNFYLVVFHPYRSLH
ncbi:cyclin-C1-2 [Arabidopsis lyrata subsp. lyrata]|uniref:cyclin-C1-2 n=1 Tax=Arabidopsis lyrata subsp. lyrata TaxID=81972 RepID=UPI000A29BA95|nr:cyclin-C1-2 [Arabidopsis lyrata subsp. lyrata]|eukprot:XP_020871439.1 cyclin-C1-2 [Arabidopsis lyrata subsp. lyrata]